MAFDGLTIKNILHEIEDTIVGGRIEKIYQPEKDEIILSIRSLGQGYKLLLSPNPSHPRLHFTNIAKDNPMTPPLFCMVLRKHLNNGKILEITQPNFERIVFIHIESMNEMGDFTRKKLIIEIMGRHSNLILVDENDTILDSIKHISNDKSSVREVLPGRTYVFPPAKEKLDTLLFQKDAFLALLTDKKSVTAQTAIYGSYNGISPVVASEICFRAHVDPTLFCGQLTEADCLALADCFQSVVEDLKANRFSPSIIKDEHNKIVEFAPIDMTQFGQYKKVHYESISVMMEEYYKEKDSVYRMNQKTTTLRKLTQQNIERCVKKKEMQQATLEDIADRDELKRFGELITANIYSIEKGMTTFTTTNYYEEDAPDITIKLDPTRTPSENAQKYFKQYNKAKRTFEALKTQIQQNDEELAYLEGILVFLQTVTTEQDIAEIRNELVAEGFLKKNKAKKNNGRNEKKSKPLHFVSSDGFDIYVGKNNSQNDELSMNFAKPNDIWLHTKNIPGSHVIIAADGKEVPDQTLTEAVNIAAFYSKASTSSLVPVDYTEKRNLKKPAGAKPGFVIFKKNKTAHITPDEALVNALKKG